MVTVAPTSLPAFNLALTLPKYDGSTEPYDFLERVEVIKTLHMLDDRVVVSFAGMHLEKSAAIWYEIEIADAVARHDIDWNQFRQGVEKRFGLSYEKAKRLLLQKKQGEDEGAREYGEALRALVRHLGTQGALYRDSLLTLFTDGLRADVKRYVLTQRPESFESAVKAAEYCERHIASGVGPMIAISPDPDEGPAYGHYQANHEKSNWEPLENETELLNGVLFRE